LKEDALRIYRSLWSLWKGLWACRKTDYEMKEYVYMVVI